MIFGLRRIIPLILLPFIFFGIFVTSFANEYAVFERNNLKGLKDRKGKEMIPPQYDELGWSDGSDQVIEGIIGYKNGKEWGIISVNNTRITEPQFTTLLPYDKNNIIASVPDSYKLNKLYGLINSSGKTIIDFKYNTIQKFGANLVVSKATKNDLFFGMINLKDELIVPLMYTSINRLNEHIIAFRDRGQLLSVFDPAGKPLLNMPLDEVELFHDRFLLMSRNGKRGLADLKGRTIAPLQFHSFLVNENDILMALPLQKWDLLSADGNLQGSLEYEKVVPVDTGYYKTNRLNYTFLIDTGGEEMFRIRNSEINFLNDTLALFQFKNRYGVIGYDGDTVVNPVYDSIIISGSRFFLNSRKSGQSGWKIADLYGVLLSSREYEKIYRIDELDLAVKINGFWGVIDKYGMDKTFAKYDSIYAKMNDYYLVDFYGEKGVIDDKGEWKIYPQKGEVYLLSNGCYLISSYFQSRVINRWGLDTYISENYLWPFDLGFIEEDFEQHFGLMNQSFESLLPVENSFVAPIVKDSVFLFKNQKGWGMIDISGRVLFKDDNRLEQIVGYNEDYIGVRIDGNYGFIDIKGNLRIANRYEGIELFHEGLANVKILGKWGCVDKIENIVVQPYFDQIGAFKNGLAIAKKNNHFGIIGRNGKPAVEFEYDSIYRMPNDNFICLLNQKYGLINDQGEIMFYPKYDSILDLDNGFIIAERKNKFGVFSAEGVFIIPVKYDQILYNPYDHLFLVSERPGWKEMMNLNDARLF